MRLLVSVAAGLAIVLLGLSVTAAFRIVDGASVLGSILAGLVVGGVTALFWSKSWK